jgi:hypothetical protein
MRNKKSKKSLRVAAWYSQNQDEESSMKIRSFFDPDSAESFALVEFLWRVKKAVPMAIIVSVIALVAVWTNTAGLMPGSKVSDKRSLTAIDAQPKSVAYRHAGPFRVRVGPPTYLHAGPFPLLKVGEEQKGLRTLWVAGLPGEAR